MTKEKKKFIPLTSSDICKIYTLLHKEGVVSFPLTPNAQDAVDATVENILGSNFGVERYPSRREKIIAHLYFLTKNHPFTDGNKRTASLVFFVLCEMNNLQPQFDKYDVDNLVVFLEQYQDNNHQDLIRKIARIVFDSFPD